MWIADYQRVAKLATIVCLIKEQGDVNGCKDMIQHQSLIATYLFVNTVGGANANNNVYSYTLLRCEG